MTGAGTVAGPRPATLTQLAAAGGGSDRMRIALTVTGAAAGTLALLAGATVASIGSGDGPYTSDLLNQQGLHTGVVMALVLLCMPLLLFVGQCTRVGAPTRDRRLAAIRMAGATPRDVTRIVATESALAGGLGAALGSALFFALRPLLDNPRPGTISVGHGGWVSKGVYGEIYDSVPATVRSLPTDVIPAWWVIIVLTVLIPIGAGLSSVVASRRVAISPFGVTHRQPSRPPRVLPAVMFLAGTVGLATWTTVIRLLGQTSLGLTTAVALLLFMLSVGGLIFGTAALTVAIGAVMAPRVRRPALLIASRRMIGSPYTASRASSGLLLAVIIGAGVQAVRANFLLATNRSDTFYATTFNLIDAVLAIAILIAAASLLVGAAEGVVERRRTLAALIAAGTPRSVLARATLAETLLPLLPTAVLAGTMGVLTARGLFGTQVDRGCIGSTGTCAAQFRAVPIPWVEVGVLVASSLLISAALTALALLFLRSSTNPTELRTAA